MGKTLSAAKVMDAMASLLSSLEIDVGPDDVTYLAVNRGHLFVGYRDGTRAGWSGPDSVRATTVSIFELVAETADAPASQLTT